MAMMNVTQAIVDSTVNMTDTFQEHVPNRMRFETYLVPVVLALMFVIGIVGNGTLILIFLRHKNLRNIINIYIFSLVLGDLLLIVSWGPFISTIFIFESWPWGEYIYKMCETIKVVSTGVSVFTLIAFSVEQYYAIVHPKKQISTKHIVIRTALAVWVISIALAIPAAVFSHCEEHFLLRKSYSISICIPFPSMEVGRIIVTFQFFIYYIIPIIVIGLFFFLIAKHLMLSTRCLSEEQGQGQSTQMLDRKKSAVIALALVIIFIICFFPMRFVMMWTYYNPYWMDDYNVFWHFFRIIGFFLEYLNSCLKPIVLYFTFKPYRKYLNYYVACCSRGILGDSTCTPTTSSTSKKQNFTIVNYLEKSQEKI
ncbi:hypothetical protein J6590_026296 [Homalodisca vitripennis]|nr:hypothetical protein J6590_026296 [Homalodisca vitripennis]